MFGEEDKKRSWTQIEVHSCAESPSLPGGCGLVWQVWNVEGAIMVRTEVGGGVDTHWLLIYT